MLESLVAGPKDNAENEEREMVKVLCADGYWSRLWIVQEIGRARQMEVRFGEIAMSWKAFIEMVTLHENINQGPLRLNSLLLEKYSGTYIFRKLLCDHREALCTEPRDKIYGLVGLAADTIGFHMDYNRTLVEVCADKMVFFNRDGCLSSDHGIHFGELVKSLLIRANSGPLEQALPLNCSQSIPTLCMEDTKNKSPRVFGLQGYVVGCIVAVGPCPTEIVPNMQKADQWDSEISQNFPEGLGEAHRESDELINYLLESKNSELESISFSHMSSVSWKKSCNYYRTPESIYSALLNNYNPNTLLHHKISQRRLLAQVYSSPRTTTAEKPPGKWELRQARPDLKTLFVGSAGSRELFYCVKLEARETPKFGSRSDFVRQGDNGLGGGRSDSLCHLVSDNKQAESREHCQ
ncbi:uncharacterized protein EAE98_003867 [Botrytis deweyae]|uniref:Heterokaryon incompatibility domain-containing protein n=1 Tax=Botrytis deweyae TaxID=2478750 RepID=A0ABQ7IRY9_9HELO|nr:uncharacterized protein EAE98_003867 [Botrytis deweyae]KAF7932568.1 hypothetical protein EAE98_003867 [Botrytis deweyae]